MVLATSSDSQQRLGHIPDFVGACARDKHLGESFGDVRFIATVAFKRLRVELTRAVVFAR